MGFCSNCGKQLRDDEVFCSGCGNAVPQQPIQPQQPLQSQQPFASQQFAQYQEPQLAETEKKTLATCALAFAFLMPIVGLILGIIGTAKYESEELKKQSIIAIPVSIVVWIVSALIMMSLIMML